MADEWPDDKFSWEVGDIEPLPEDAPAEEQPLCFVCVHRFPGVLMCKAYPKGIPERFATNREKHIVQQGDDNGFTFEPRESGSQT